jgi:hypothetical protein
VSDVERNNLQVFHSFAGNSLDRSEVERRSPKWISSLINNPSTKFLLAKDFMFPVIKSTKQLVWITKKELQNISKPLSEDSFFSFRNCR